MSVKMASRLLHAALVWLAAISWVMAGEAETSHQPVSDVRVLIDVSGSMKKNDPDNLRVPALQLLTQLMPMGSRGGVWTFGQYVNMSVPLGRIEAPWKDKAYAAAGQINSLGLFTNIEDALKKATVDWNKPDNRYRRSVVLLTDGVVDISKDAAVNEASRERIMNEIVPRLRDAGVTVHTIALSSEADEGFLRQMSAATRGWFEKAANADQLERVFLRMFEKAVVADTLPLKDNRIKIDGSIKEATLLIFRKAGAAEAEIVLPDGSHLTQKKLPANVQWRHEKNYDLVTVAKPPAGEWKILADIDPDNRVMVVTDLKLVASRLPNVMLVGEAPRLTVELAQQGRTITERKFLDLVKMSLDELVQGKPLRQLTPTDDGKGADKKAADGRYSVEVTGGKNGGEFEYRLVVDGGTFQREQRQTVRVVNAPAEVSVRETSAGKYTVAVVPYGEVMDLESMLLDASVVKPNGDKTTMNLMRAGGNEWRLNLDVAEGESYQVTLSLQADRRSGGQIDLQLGPYHVGKGAPAPEPAEAKPAPAPVKAAAPVARQRPAEKAGKAAASKKPAKPDWVMVTAKVVGFNAILIAIGVFVWWKWFRTPAPRTEETTAETPKKSWFGWLKRLRKSKPKTEEEPKAEAEESTQE